MDKLTLKNVEIVFANLEDEGFGKSITINCTDKEIKATITKWVKDNKIGKGENAGKPNFKEYEDKLQYAFKINDYTVFAGLNGLDKSNLGFGATVSLTAKAFDYDNKFGKGTSGALSAVVVEGRAKTGSDDDLSELLGGREVSQKTNDEPLPEDTTDYDKPIDLSSIPF
jgi:hypothetical protein